MVEDEVSFNAPIPGQGLTAELGARPWQTPPQYTTVEDALDYYIPRLESEEVSEQPFVSKTITLYEPGDKFPAVNVL